MKCFGCDKREKYESHNLCFECLEEMRIMEEIEETTRLIYEEELQEEADEDKSVRVYDEYGYFHQALLYKNW